MLEPLSGYLLLAKNLVENGVQYADAWNFGPEDDDAKNVQYIIERICKLWGHGASSKLDNNLINNGSRGKITKQLQEKFQQIISGHDKFYQSWLTYIK